MPRPLALVAASLAFLACGPVQSTSLLLDADVQLEAARTAGAAERAPYEWTAANLYLHKAKEEIGYSNYEVALTYAEKAKRLATEARERSVAAGRSEPTGAPPSPVQGAPTRLQEGTK